MNNLAGGPRHVEGSTHAVRQVSTLFPRDHNDASSPFPRGGLSSQKRVKNNQKVPLAAPPALVSGPELVKTDQVCLGHTAHRGLRGWWPVHHGGGGCLRTSPGVCPGRKAVRWPGRLIGLRGRVRIRLLRLRRQSHVLRSWLLIVRVGHLLLAGLWKVPRVLKGLGGSRLLSGHHRAGAGEEIGRQSLRAGGGSACLRGWGLPSCLGGLAQTWGHGCGGRSRAQLGLVTRTGQRTLRQGGWTTFRLRGTAVEADTRTHTHTHTHTQTHTQGGG